MRMKWSDVVLLHGLYHQPAHMQPLVSELEKRDVNVHVPTLHRGSLAADIAAAQRAVDASQRGTIVVGHSYGGAVAGGVEGAVALVFIAAFVLDIGESCATLSGPQAPVNAWAQPHPSGGTFIPAGAARELSTVTAIPRQPSGPPRSSLGRQPGMAEASRRTRCGGSYRADTSSAQMTAPLIRRCRNA